MASLGARKRRLRRVVASSQKFRRHQTQVCMQGHNMTEAPNELALGG